MSLIISLGLRWALDCYVWDVFWLGLYTGIADGKIGGQTGNMD
jgi:hypothetical protein